MGNQKSRPVVLGALGSVSREFKKYMDKLNIQVDVEVAQKDPLLGTARILRKVLEMC